MKLNDSTVMYFIAACNRVSEACGCEKHNPLMYAAIQACRDALKAFANDRVLSINYKVRHERSCKFNKDVRDELRRLYNKGITQKELAKMVGTTQAYISILLSK